jgi:CubicO group peptidase (beta-lactamase class C family)
VSIQDFVTNEILTPLGMTSTSFSPSSYEPKQLANGYSLDPQGNWRPYDISEADSFAGAGGMVSTVHDLSIWATWLGEAFRPGKSLGIDVLSRASRREMQRLESVIPPSIGLEPDGAWKVDVSGYALGLFANHDLHRGVIVHHAGGLPGYVLDMRWHPESGLGLVMLSNSHRGSPVALARECHARLLRAYDAPSETIALWKETVAARVAAEELIRHWNDDNALELFAKNVDFDRPIADRRAEIDALVAVIGPLKESRPVHEDLSAATPADVTWSIPGSTSSEFRSLFSKP